MGKKDQIKRIKEIQRRKKQRRRKRLITNFMLFAAVLILIFWAVSCHNKRKEEKLQANSATAVPTADVSQAPAQKNKQLSGTYKDFFLNSAFVGNSFIDGMEIYELLDDVDYFAKVGLSVSDAMTESTTNGVKPVIDELDSDKSYDRIFMMFGENEVGWANSDAFVEQYEKLIKKAKKYQPDAEIYLLSITPISESVSEEAIDDTTNENIVKYNKLIKQVAKNQDVTYCDIYQAVVNPKGALPDDAASDGIHFTKEYYEKCLKYISKNYSDTQQTDVPEDDSSDETAEITGKPARKI